MGYRGFKISDASKFCGFSPQGLRFLEDKHVAEPKRDEASGYRYYNLWEVGRILRVKVFRSLGFSMDETLELTRASSVEKACDILSRQGAAIAENMRRERANLLLLQRRAARIAAIPQRKSRIVREMLPPYYQVVYARLNACTDDAQTVQVIEEWNGYTPLAHSMPTFHWDGEKFSSLWSTLGAFEEDIRDCDLGLEVGAPCIEYHEAVPALSTVFSTTEEEAERQFMEPDATPFSLFTAYLEENGLAPAGDCILYPLLTAAEDGESRSYYLCWMPYGERG